jgi:integrase
MKYEFPDWDTFSKYLDDERHVQPQSTIKSMYTSIVLYFSDLDWTKENFRLYLAYLKTEKRLSTNRINKYIVIAKHIDNYYNARIIDQWKLYPVEPPQKTKIIMTDAQMESICNCSIEYKPYINETKELNTKRANNHNARYKALFSVMRFSGMPPDDVVNLKWQSYHGTYFEVYRRKTKQIRKVPIPGMIRPYIDALLKYEHGYIFGSDRGKLKKATLNKELTKRVVKLGYDERITPYCFRYSFDTLCAKGGGEANLPQIAKIAGHSLQTAYNYYLQYSVDDLADALEASHPGLRGDQNIDNIKRVIMDTVKKFVDGSKYEVDIVIKPKNIEERKITLS